jgi:hypothetical protein
MIKFDLKITELFRVTFELVNNDDLLKIFSSRHGDRDHKLTYLTFSKEILFMIISSISVERSPSPTDLLLEFS